MVASLRLGRAFGIPLLVHWTFWILPLWVVLEQAGQTLVGLHLAVLFALFGCVVLHELGHALAARWYGIRTRDITLYPIGGVARLERMSDKPAEELVIAVAGPAVNVVIAGALGLGMFVGAALAPGSFGDSLLAEFLAALLLTNVGMVLFNMIPAFPLDGGRVLRATLGFFMDYLRATRVAVRISTILAVLLPPFVYLIWPQFASPFLIVIAFVIISAGQRELAALEQRERYGQMPPSSASTPVMADGDMPAWPRPAVTVYVQDPQTGAWVRQGQG